MSSTLKDNLGLEQGRRMATYNLETYAGKWMKWFGAEEPILRVCRLLVLLEVISKDEGERERGRMARRRRD